MFRRTLSCIPRFGPGAYFAEASSKADEYAEDEEGGLYAELYAMVLCRVCCGAMYHNPSATVETRVPLKACEK